MLRADVALRLGSLDLQVDLAVEAGQVVALLGPNGAGKTTLLRALAGLLPIARGRVALDGVVMEDTEAGRRMPAEQRPVGMVFQDYLLFPHLSILDNVAFGLRSRGASRGEARQVADGWLGRLGLEALRGARPTSASGGQQQRVALARALAPSPRLLLLDEPLAALDISTRSEVRRDLRRYLQEFTGVSVLVTHDPLEAMALGDRLIVIEEGRVIQSGTAVDVTERPRSPYVADLVGVNLLRGEADGGVVRVQDGGVLTVAGDHTGEVFAAVPPRAISLWRSRPEGSPRNTWLGRTASLDLQGDRVRVGVSGEPPVVAEITPAALHDLGLVEGSDVWVSIKATEVTVYPA